MECKSIKDANIILFKRYLDITNQDENYSNDKDIVLIKKMCKTAIETDMLVDKQSRWLGFVQGILYGFALLNVKEERDFSRPLFHSAYKNMGIDKPDTISL